MKKRTKSLVLLLILLAVLVAAFLTLRLINAAKARREAEQDAASLIGAVAADPTELVCVREGEELRFTLDGDVWRLAEEPDLPLTQTYVTRLVTTAQKLSAERELPVPEDLGEYGLDDPSCELRITDAGGGVWDLLIGGRAGENRYAMLAGGDAVYTISSTLAEYLNTDLMSMVKLDTMQPVTEDDLRAIELTGPDSAFTFEKVTMANGSYTWYANVDGVRGDQIEVYAPQGLEEPAKDLLDRAVSALKNQSFVKCVDFRPEDPAAYGLHTPRCTVRVAYTLTGDDKTRTNGEYTLRIGAQVDDAETGETYYYAALEGSDMVCTLEASDVEPLLHALELLGV